MIVQIISLAPLRNTQNTSINKTQNISTLWVGERLRSSDFKCSQNLLNPASLQTDMQLIVNIHSIPSITVNKCLLFCVCIQFCKPQHLHTMKYIVIKTQVIHIFRLCMWLSSGGTTFYRRAIRSYGD